ncbi:MAG TPA: hypothetical protein VIV14_07640 [Gammaproteobacteria bacterium]
MTIRFKSINSFSNVSRALWNDGHRIAIGALVFALLASPSFAQLDLSGMWVPLPRNQDGSGETGDAAGVPLSLDGRRRGHSWSPEEFDTAEWVCRPHAWDYSLEGPLSQIRFWPVIDFATQRIIAYRGHINMEQQETVIWMDGRPHPPENAPHTWSGFTTGEWEGDVLVTTTTHLKEAYIRRTGLMRSDQATVRTRWKRIGDYLQATSILYDPVLLTEPYVRSSAMWVNTPDRPMSPYPCEEATETVVPRGAVSHFLPGRSPLPGIDPNSVDEFGTPYVAKLGGAETMLPEFADAMENMEVSPADADPVAVYTRTRGEVTTRHPIWGVELEGGPAPGEVQVLPVKGNVYALFGAGANITMQVGDDGILLVDAGVASMSDEVLAAIRSVSDGPIRYIINTTHRREHTGGNDAVAAAGEQIPWRDESYGAGPQGALGAAKASVIAYLNVFTRMVVPPDGGDPLPEGGWPDNTYSTPWKRLYFNDEPVIITRRVGTTDADSVVLFRRSDVVSTGDLLDLTRFPRIDPDSGGSLEGLLESLNYLISIVTPEANSGGGTLVVPGHGRIADHAEVAYYRDMVSIIRDRVRSMIDQGMSREDVVDAGPTWGYDARYGSDRGDWTTDMFVEAVYDSFAN